MNKNSIFDKNLQNWDLPRPIILNSATVTPEIMNHIYVRMRREFDDSQNAAAAKRKAERDQEREEAKKLRKNKRIKKRMKKKSQKLLYGKHKSGDEHVQEQLARLQAVLDANAVSAPEMENEANAYFVEVEEVEKESNYNYDYREEPVEYTPADRRREMAEKRKAWREEKKALNALSDTFRRLEAALSSDEVANQARERTDNTYIQHDVGKFDGTTEENTAEDLMLQAVLGMYGHEFNIQNVPNSHFVDPDHLRIIDENLQSAFEHNLQEKQQVPENNYDKADWDRALHFRGMGDETIAELKVKDEIKKFAASQKARSGTQRSVSFLQNLGQESNSMPRIEEGFTDEESGMHDDILNGGWIQIGLGSSNNTACDLKACQSSSFKRCIGVLRKRFPNILSPTIPQEITVSVTGTGTDRKLYYTV